MLLNLLPTSKMPKHYRSAGKEGKAAKYITRSKAVKRLQVSLSTFRKLCILKGIVPREPKKKIEGNHRTYYHKKDILSLQHDPLLEKFRSRFPYEKIELHDGGSDQEDSNRKRDRCSSHSVAREHSCGNRRRKSFLDKHEQYEESHNFITHDRNVRYSHRIYGSGENCSLEKDTDFLGKHQKLTRRVVLKAIKDARRNVEQKTHQYGERDRLLMMGKRNQKGILNPRLTNITR